MDDQQDRFEVYRRYATLLGAIRIESSRTPMSVREIRSRILAVRTPVSRHRPLGHHLSRLPVRPADAPRSTHGELKP